MERMCGDFQRNLGSKSIPSSNINKRVLHGAYLGQLESRFDFSAELADVGRRPKGILLRNEFVKEGCELCRFAIFRKV
jgi:hypothetical protein